MEESLDALIRRTDEDRWLASRFAATDVRARLIAIYALNYEIARTAEVVKEPAIGEIRLAWWREAIAEIHIGKPPRAHPVLQAYAPLAAGLPVACWEALTIARAKDFEAAPFACLGAGGGLCGAHRWRRDAVGDRRVRWRNSAPGGVCAAGSVGVGLSGLDACGTVLGRTRAGNSAR